MPSYARERLYPLTPAEAWSLLADTDHLNRAIGLPRFEFEEPRGFIRRARARFYGIASRWREFPFEWVRERRYAVRRDFLTGPVRRVVGGIELAPAEGGTIVRVFADVTPRSPLARPLLPLVALPTIRKTLDYCDRYLTQRADPAAPPRPAEPGPVDRAVLDRALAALADAPVDPELVRRLEALVLRGSDDQLVRVRPYALAERWSADRRDVLRLFFHATRAGLFDLRWELMCPACRVPKDEARTLEELPGRFHCETCRIDYEVDFDERVELRFTVRPAVRAAEDVVYCIGSPMRSPHVVAQQYLEPGEVRFFEMPADGPLSLRAVGEPDAVSLDGPRFTALAWDAEGWRPIPRAIGANDPAAARQLQTDDLVVVLENHSGDRPLLAVVEHRARDPEAATAAEVTLLQEFRDLFGAEVLAPGHQVGIATIAVLFTDLKGSTALYEGAGDAPAYGEVRRHFEYLRERVADAGGAVIKTIGDAVMAAFPRVEDALAAALEMQAGIEAWCRAEGISPPLVLRVGLHAGPAVAVNANERLDYFGRTVNLAARIQRQAMGGQVTLAAELWDEPALRRIAHQRGAVAERFEAELPGIAGRVALVRLAVPGPVAA